MGGLSKFVCVMMGVLVFAQGNWLYSTFMLSALLLMAYMEK